MKKCKRVVIISLLALVMVNCTDEKGARKVLERNNYKVISVGGYDILRKSNDDVYSTSFKAVAPNGDIVTGCVTKGFFKGSTIRLDD